VLRVRSRFTVRATAPKRHARLAKGGLGALGVTSLLLGMVATSGPAAAEGNCENAIQYEALGAADGLRTHVVVEGGLVGGEENPVTASLPGSQARIHAVFGSKGWAGAPYSATVADNIGATGEVTERISQPQLSDGAQLPVFAIAEYPSSASASKTLPGGGLEAKSSADSASGKAAIGAASSDAGTVGSVTTTSSASCAADMTLEAVGDSVATGIDIGGVLRIASIRSHARVVLTAAGERTLEGTLEINGATVGGQAVSITEKGVVLAGSASALPKDPIRPALKEAGITVTYIEGVEDPDEGQILAPTLQVKVAQTATTPNGPQPVAVTYDFGRALALAALDGVEAGPDELVPDVPVDDFSTPTFDEGFSEDVSADLGSVDPVGGETSTETTPRKSGSAANVATARIADWSIAPGYSAMGVGALLLLAAWIGLERIAVRLRWR
jgi:hypothetical protein